MAKKQGKINDTAIIPSAKNEDDQRRWKILIADDEEEVHVITKMVLADYSFDGSSLEFLSSYSGAETIELIKNNPDTAVLILDVVMETDDAGLDVIKILRNELQNHSIRIILRTGQAGKVPEKKVIMEYDINDYKEKTELTAQKLFTSITSALRSYKYISFIENNKNALEEIIKSSSILFKYSSINNFADIALNQLVTFFDKKHKCAGNSGFALVARDSEYKITTATGKYEKLINTKADISLPETEKKHVAQALFVKSSLFIEDAFIGYYPSDKFETVLYATGFKNINAVEKNMLLLYSANIGIALNNALMKQNIVDTQKEVINTLGEIVETRSRETAYHVIRVAEYSRILAKGLGFDDDTIELIKNASPMHDVGKIGIPDSILNKPAKLSEKEFDLIKNHTIIGHDFLSKSDQELLRVAAIIALQHHERWDGKGYPHGIAGKNIHIYGRITMIADVFDALTQKRVYKEAIEMSKVVEMMKEERGAQFDPELIDIFLSSLDKFSDVMNKHTDI